MEQKTYSLFQKAFIISFGKVFNRISALFVIVYLSYQLPKQDYGSYRQVWLLFNMFVPILSLGMPISVNYFFPLLRLEEKKTFIFQTYFSLLGLGFLFSMLFFFSASFFSNLFNNDQIEELMRYFCLIPFLALPTLFYQNLFVCLDNAILAVKISLLSSFFYCLSIILPIELGYSISEMIYFLSIYYFFQFLIISYLYHFTFKQSLFKFNRSLVVQQFKYAIPVGISASIGIITINIDNIFISSYFDTKLFAEYANGAMEIPIIGIITGSVMAVFMPEFVKKYNNNNINSIIQLWHSSIIKVAMLFFPLMCFLYLFSYELIIIFFSDLYKEGISSDIFRIYLLQLPCRITIFSIILLSINQSKFVLKSSILCLIVNVLLNYILIQEEYFGILGPAVATVASLYLTSFLQLNYISRKFNIKLSDIFPWFYLMKLLCISILSALIISILDFNFLNLFNNYLFNNILIVFIGVCFYSLLFILFGFLTKTLTYNLRVSK